MNCVLLSNTTGLELDSYDIHSASLLSVPIEESYATAPMVVVSPVEHRYDEEELHTSFEQAISDRVSALHGRLSRISAQQPIIVSQAATTTNSQATTTEPLNMASLTTRALSGNLRQRGIVLVSLALGFAMLGFDFMGLLVLHMR